jgi:predicted CoA-binding protein
MTEKHQDIDDEAIFDILKKTNNIAVVGLSPSGSRPSHRVAAYLKSVGYKIIPIRPLVAEVLGEKAYKSLEDIPPDIKIDMVDIFKRADEVPAIVRSAIARGGVKTIWMQEGIVNEDAAREARQAGMTVVMDSCTYKEHRRMMEGR